MNAAGEPWSPIDRDSGDPAADFLLGDINTWTQQSANEIDLRQWRLALYANLG